MRTKVEYSIDAPAKHARPSSRLRFEPVTTRAALSLFRAAIREIIMGSLDRSDQAAAERGEIEVQAHRLAEPDTGFTYDPSRWALAYEQDDRLIGIAQPVIFAGCEREGLQEGTIHYIGVLPLNRGQGYINDLVRFTTWRLAELDLCAFTPTPMNVTRRCGARFCAPDTVKEIRAKPKEFDMDVVERRSEPTAGCT